MINVPYDYYKVFYYVAEYKSMSKAAKKLYTNQPNVTRNIKNLEGILNTTLFNRCGNGVVLTKEGQKLYDKIHISIEGIINAENNIESEKNLRTGLVNIYIDDVLMCDDILDIFSDFKKKHTQIKINITGKESEEICKSVKFGSCDIGYIINNQLSDDYTESIKLKEWKLSLLCGSEYIRYTNIELNFDEFSKLPIISTKQDSYLYSVYYDLFNSYGKNMGNGIEVDSIHSILNLIKHGLGVAILPDCLTSGIGGIYKIKTEFDLPSLYAYLVKRKNEYLNPIQKEIVKNSIKLSDRK